MTLYAARKPGTDLVTVSMTYGPVTAQAEEPAGHVLAFWHDLGRIVAAQDNEARAKAGYARYCTDAGEPAYTWDELPEDMQRHWIAAFTE